VFALIVERGGPQQREEERSVPLPPTVKTFISINAAGKRLSLSILDIGWCSPVVGGTVLERLFVIGHGDRGY
jgi:hypothetical protein